MNALLNDSDRGDMYGQVTPLRPDQAVSPSAESGQKALPLPGWLIGLYFLFPIVLYLPDAIFNYYVYSDGAYIPNASLPLQISQVALWGFLSIGVVGMAYLLSVLAPWHWSQNHHLQAMFCWVGVLVATGITVWNSLSYRSSTFKEFATDKWLYAQFPQLADQHISMTMILVAIAPPFWGLFWALVQPTRHGHSLNQLRESHQEKLLRVQHESELKRMRAEANAKVREAQLKGMAQTAAAARQQAGTLFSRQASEKAEKGGKGGGQTPASAAPRPVAPPSGTLPEPPAPRRTGTLQFVQPDTQEDPDEPDMAPRASAAKPSRKTTAKSPATRVATPTPAPVVMASASAIDDGGALERGDLSHVTSPSDRLQVTDQVYRAPRA